MASSTRTFTASLTVAETDAILRNFPTAFRTRISEILLTALAVTLSPWLQTLVLQLDLEGHGREAIFDDLDVSRTVGWFTTVFPMRLQLHALNIDLVDALTSIKGQLRAIPRGGIGYGLLRELCSDEQIRSELRAQPASQVLFNYLGQN